MPSNDTLAVVIPVYNEEKNISSLLRDWLPVFRNTGSSCRVIVIDDGSRDNSLAILKKMCDDNPDLEVCSQANAGHGPAILKGYSKAVEADWVFQIDSDHQLDTTAFTQLWDNREGNDLLLAERLEKNASAGRRIISVLSLLVVRLLYGRGVRDVNVPYRLMRGSMLREALKIVPEDSFAPNILITGWFIRQKCRIFTTTTLCRKDDLARASRMSLYFYKGAVRSAFQTILFRLK